MTSQPPERPDPPENSNLILRKRDRLIKTFQERDWSGFLLEILVIIISVGGPSGVVLLIVEKAFPDLLRGYWIAFVGVVIVLFTLCVVLELCKRRRYAGSPPRSSWKLFSRLKTPLILFFSIVALFYAWNFIKPFVIPQLNSSLSCDVQPNKDCFSWGEDVLLSDFKSDSQDDDWRAKCYRSQSLKILGISSYNPTTFEVAKQNFENYIQQCPNDSEARIYLNNVIAELAGNPIRVAVSVPISRYPFGAFESQDTLRGVAFAQYQINEANGIGGRKLLVGIADDGYREFDKVAVEETAKFLADNKSIVGVIGHVSSPTVAVTEETYEKSGIVAISPTSTAVRQSSSDEKSDTISPGGYIFRTSPNDQVAASLLAKKWADLYGDKGIAIVHNAEEIYSKSFRENFLESLKNEGGSVINKDSPEDNRCDISKAVNKQQPNLCLDYIKRFPLKAQGLLLIPGSNEEDFLYMQKLMEKNYKVNETPLKLLGSDTMSLSENSNCLYSNASEG
ncbi:MAG: ABC transporter substrate-binding protein [Leptolyngbyaceae cyanobacterium CSU_1_4]|nr:ABC transporter substrate-binding protein [Leptolyngbyaceae cyanobacterium CSU_1_4]